MLKKAFTAALVALSLGAAVVATTSPAAAYCDYYGHCYHHYYHHYYQHSYGY